MIGTTATYDNSNYTEDMEAESGFSTPLLKFAAIMTILIMIVGIVGNFLTVAALINCPKVRNVAAAFIMSLCIADLLFCALVLPFSAYRFIQGTWTPREFLCKMIPFIQYGNIGVSLLCIAMITINRYVMIAHHSSYGKIYKRHWIAAMIIFCWVFSYGMQLPTLVGAWGTFDYDPKLGTCSIMNDDHGRSSKTALFVTAFVIPCIIIIACYAKIFWVVHKSEQRMKRHAKKQNSIPNNLRVITSSNVELGNGQSKVSSADSSSFSTDVKQEAVQKQTPSRVKDQREVRAKRNEWRITKMVLAIFLSFVICYLPITIAKVADQDVNQPTLHIFSYIMLYLSACLNPIIYVIMNKQYRKAYKTVLMCDVGRFLGCTKKGKVDGKGGPADSSVAEKWKDTELSHNHSRTLVSQMSANDQLNTSFSGVTPVMMAAPSVTLELVAKVNASSFNGTMAAGKKPPPTPMRRPPLAAIDTNLEAIIKEPKIVENNKQQSQENIPSQNNNNNINNSNRCPISQPPLIIRSKTGSKEPNRIALVGGDIILEEEEEEEDNNEQAAQLQIIETTRQMPLRRTDLEPVLEMLETSVTPPTPPPPVVQRMIVRPTPVYVNASVLHQKKSLFYGQNINDTPDNENVKPKLQDKPKL